MKANGFTLVELSIVMIIIGLLIGGVFGGIRLVENAQVQKTIQDIKSIESATLTFRDTYGRLPGDLRNPSTRLPNCTTAPCATGGNGDRSIGGLNNPDWNTGTLTNNDERFVFWHHLQASDFIQMGYSNTMSMEFGEGQPAAPVDGGYRFIFDRLGGWAAQASIDGHVLEISGRFNAVFGGTASQPTDIISCNKLSSIDFKLDDGSPSLGRFLTGSVVNACTTAASTDPGSRWLSSGSGSGQYVFRF